LSLAWLRNLHRLQQVLELPQAADFFNDAEHFVQATEAADCAQFPVFRAAATPAFARLTFPAADFALGGNSQAWTQSVTARKPGGGVYYCRRVRRARRQ
jgi:hypothetical protein